MRRRYQRTTNDADLRQERRLRYQESNRTYLAKLREAKLKSWKVFYSGTQSSNPWNSVQRYAAAKIWGPLTLSTLKANNNTHCQYPKHSQPADVLLYRRRLGVQRRSPPQKSQTIDDITYAHNRRHSIYATRNTGCIGIVRLTEGSRQRCPNQRGTSSDLQELPYPFHRSIQRISTQRTLSTTLKEINNTPDSETGQGGTQCSAQIPPH
jgi:hypothetical protein